MFTPPPLPGESTHTLEAFIRGTSRQDAPRGVFELQTDRLLEVNLNGRVNTKMGSMVAYQGSIRFRREGVLDQGLGGLLKKAVSSEGMSITYADGQGRLYLADGGKKVSIIRLQQEALVVNGNDVLAFEPSLRHTITLMRRVAAMLSGGLFNIRVEGTGLLAITSHGEPHTLRVEPGKPVCTDPNATLAWSGNLAPRFKTDASLGTLVGRGSGESLQMVFEGSGFVVIQPCEETVVGSDGT